MSYLDDFERHDGEWLVHAPCGWVVSLDRVPVELVDDAGGLLCPECASRWDEDVARADWFQREKQPGDPFAALRWCDSLGVHARLDAIVARERAAERARHRRDGGRARSTVGKAELAAVLRANVACGNSDGTNIWPGTREIERRSGVTYKRVLRCKDLFVADGVLIDTGERRGRGGTPVLRAALSEIPGWSGAHGEVCDDEDEEVVDAELVPPHEAESVRGDATHAELAEPVPSHEAESVTGDEVMPPDDELIPDARELIPPESELIPSHETEPDLASTSTDLALTSSESVVVPRHARASARTRASVETQNGENDDHNDEGERTDAEAVIAQDGDRPEGEDEATVTSTPDEDHDEQERTRRALADRWATQRPDGAQVELESQRLAGASMLLGALGPAQASALIDREARTAKPSTTLIHLAMREANRKPDRAA